MAEALSITEATGLLDAAQPPPEEEQPAALAQDAEQPEEIEAQPSAEDADEPEEAIEGEPEVEDEPAQPELSKPASWASDADETWRAIPREAQEIILARETERDTATSVALQKAAETRREAEAHIQSVTQLQATLNEVLPQAQRVFQNKWSNWTPEYQVQLARENPGEYIAQKTQFEAEQAQLAHFQGIQANAEKLAFEGFVRQEGERLKTLAPDLADPKEGPARRQAVATFLMGTGVPEDQISRLDANAIALANDAMKWRQAQGQIARPKQAPPAPRPTRPVAAAAVRTPQRNAAEAKNRFAQTGRVEDAVAYMNLKG